MRKYHSIHKNIVSSNINKVKKKENLNENICLYYQSFLTYASNSVFFSKNRNLKFKLSVRFNHSEELRNIGKELGLKVY